MFRRQTTGSVVCPSCGRLVGVNDETCLNCGRRRPGMWGFSNLLKGLGDEQSFPRVVMGVCLVLYLLQLVLDPSAVAMRGLFGLFAPGGCTSFLLGASGELPVVGWGRWWTVLSAGLLHGGLIHIGFNLLWVRQLGPSVAQAYGTGRAAILFVISSALGFVLTTLVSWLVHTTVLGRLVPSFLVGAQFTLGASAAIFGWLGALIVFGQRSGQTAVARNLMYSFALPLFILGFLLPGVDNWAHAGGFLGGWLGGRFLDPTRPERGDHALIGALAFGACLVAVVVSVVHGLQIFDDPVSSNLLGCSR